MIAMALSLILAVVLLVFIFSPSRIDVSRWPQPAAPALIVSFDGHGITIG